MNSSICSSQIGCSQHVPDLGIVSMFSVMSFGLEYYTLVTHISDSYQHYRVVKVRCDFDISANRSSLISNTIMSNTLETPILFSKILY